MSVTATRKVSGSEGITHGRIKSTYGVGSKSDSFVEAIDASNRVSVHAELDKDGRGKNRKQEQPETEVNPDMLIDSTFVESALSALSASGIYEEKGLDIALKNMENVGIYSHNYFVINGEKAEFKANNEEEDDNFFFDYEAFGDFDDLDLDEIEKDLEKEEESKVKPEVDKFI